MAKVLGTRGLAVALAGAVLLAPPAARACAVCTAGRDDETAAAFFGTTILLSVLPLVFVGGLVWWLRRRARFLDAERARQGAPAPARARS